ncbi:hypothetical protein KOR42_25650 [Thalassoglobus neptunius]|uniref:Rhamnogalacturonan lyase domain-containing protein n=1 Tax=Thalassoglobus neptunius TaxID=1938619 RepID=A0A5C5WXS1_9PLAN|nr:hypothetical protein [Thalassoglobus neptunius]TWT55754.1 hypothetical protein KOR42_25650 [Thalassoglobus neptunius]
MLRTALCVCAVLASSVTTVQAQGWGTIEGQFILEGDVPEVAPLVAKGDASAKDAAVCAANAVPNDAMAFNSENKGIANIVVFMRRASSIHPDLKESTEKNVEFDQKGCRFLPHAMVVRTDQTITCKSSDGVAHNVHSSPFANSPANFIVQPNDQKGVEVKVPLAESLPVQVVCDIHPWMKAWWIVLDHPYAAVTDENGKFTIENLPEGENEFRVWHENAGYINRKWVVNVKAGEVTKVETVEVPLSSFEE